MTKRTAVMLVAAAVLASASAAAGPWADAVYLLGFGLVVVVAVSSALRTGDRRAWVPVAAALTVWWCGDALYVVLTALGLADGPTPSDVLWLAGYPLLMLGVLRMVAQRAPWALVECTLDALIFTTALGLTVWRFVLVPVLADSDLTDLVVQSLYPGGDALLVGALVLLLFSPGRNGWSGWLLMVALSLTVTGDAIAVLLPESGVTDPVLLLANVTMAAAVAHRDRDVVSTPASGGQIGRMHTARAVFLGVALWVPALVAVLGQGGGPIVTVGVAVGSTVVCGAASVRFVLSARRREQAEITLYHRATRDPLTGLANRATLEESVEGGAPWASGGALLYLDLDGFKPVNDQHGHRAGDEVLTVVAARLRARAGRDAVTARVGGDEFAVLLLGGAERADSLAREVVHDLAVPVLLPGTAGVEVTIGASVGVLRWTGPVRTQVVLHVADSLMYAAKQSGQGWRSTTLRAGAQDLDRDPGGGRQVRGDAASTTALPVEVPRQLAAGTTPPPERLPAPAAVTPVPRAGSPAPARSS